MENLAKTLGMAKSTTTGLAWDAEVLVPALKQNWDNLCHCWQLDGQAHLKTPHYTTECSLLKTSSIFLTHDHLFWEYSPK